MGWFSKKYIAYKTGGHYSIIDLSGKVIKQKLCSDFFHLSEGLAGVKVYGKWGFVDENFKTIIKPQFTEKLVYAFHEELSRFKKNGKVGVIDKTGKVILPARYDNLYEFSDGLAAFQQNGKWGYINSAGEVIIPAQYYDAQNFKHGMAKVKTDYSTANLIDKNNNYIIKDIWDIHIISEKLIAVRTGDGWGLFLLN